MTSSGGNPMPIAFDVIVLPKNKKDSISTIPFFINVQSNYIIYADETKLGLIHILNIETRKNQMIALKPIQWESRGIPGMSIEETKIANNTFYIKYQTLDSRDSIISIQKSFKLKI
jgi:hypothetical protein